jgi:hypothetical protein
VVATNSVLAQRFAHPTFIRLVRTSAGVVDLDWDVRLTAGDDIDQMSADDGVIGSAEG